MSKNMMVYTSMHNIHKYLWKYLTG